MIDPTYDERGLVPCVVQDAATGTVLMLAWQNAEALRLTRETRVAHFWSRSRQQLWKKGETSGHMLAVTEIRIDCDADAVLLLAHPHGPTCHTNATSCFFHRDDAPDDDGVPNLDGTMLSRLAGVLRARRDASAEKSYTKSLLAAGWPKILAKLAEEHGELAAELPEGPRDAVVHEAADVIFHLMVGLTARDIPIEDVLAELARRFGTSGHVEKAERTQ